MNCNICNEKIVLIPSAKERAEKFGGKPSDYTSIFTTHSHCALEERKKSLTRLIKKHYSLPNN